MNVIFDTNVYRNIVQDKDYEDFNNFLKNILKPKEIEKNIIVLTSSNTIVELICHLKHNDDFQEVCYKSLYFMSRHIRINIDNTKYRITHLYGFYQLFKEFFHSENPFNTKRHKYLVFFLFDKFNICNHKYNESDETFQEFIADVKKTKDDEREMILGALLQILEYYNDGVTDFGAPKNKKNKSLRNKINNEKKNDKMILIKLFLKNIYQKIYQGEPEEKILNSFIKKFNLSLIVFNEEILEYLTLKDSKSNKLDDLNKSSVMKKWNALFDMQILFSYEFQKNKGKNIMLVTDDMESMKKHIKAEKGAEDIISLEEYYKYLEIPYNEYFKFLPINLRNYGSDL